MSSHPCLHTRDFTPEPPHPGGTSPPGPHPQALTPVRSYRPAAQIFGGHFVPPEFDEPPRHHFDSIAFAMLTVFTVATGENSTDSLAVDLELYWYRTGTVYSSV